MRILVKSNDARVYEKLQYFADESNKEYSKMRKGIKLRVLGLTGRIPDELAMIAVKRMDGVILDIPLSVPELELLQEAIRRYLHMTVTPKWKTKMAEQINGYLKHEGIEFKSIEILESDVDEVDSVSGDKKKDNADSGKG